MQSHVIYGGSYDSIGSENFGVLRGAVILLNNDLFSCNFDTNSTSVWNFNSAVILTTDYFSPTTNIEVEKFWEFPTVNDYTHFSFLNESCSGFADVDYEILPSTSEYRIGDP